MRCDTGMVFSWRTRHTVAKFQQVDKNRSNVHHDALEFPDGKVVLLTRLCKGERATVLQLPASPRVAVDEPQQGRLPRRVAGYCLTPGCRSGLARLFFRFGGNFTSAQLFKAVSHLSCGVDRQRNQRSNCPWSWLWDNDDGKPCGSRHRDLGANRKPPLWTARPSECKRTIFRRRYPGRTMCTRG